MEVSAKSNINIETAFYSLARDIKKRLMDTSGSNNGAAQQQSGIPVGTETKGAASGCC